MEIKEINSDNVEDEQDNGIRIVGKRPLDDDGCNTSSNNKQKGNDVSNYDEWQLKRQRIIDEQNGPSDVRVCNCLQNIAEDIMRDPKWYVPLLPKTLYFQLCTFHDVIPVDPKSPCVGGIKTVMELIWSNMSEKRLAQSMVVCREWGRAIPFYVNDSRVRRKWTWFHDNPGGFQIKRPTPDYFKFMSLRRLRQNK